MNKVLMISIRPEYAVNILNGKKKLELRTWIPKDYVGWMYLCVSKGVKDILYKYKDRYYTQHYLTFTDDVEVLNSKVVARFWFDEYDTLEYINMWGGSEYVGNNQSVSWNVDSNYLDNLYLDYQDVLEYGFREKPKRHQKTLFAWHIKKLEIFDEPKSLSDFIVGLNYLGDIIPPTYKKLKKTPKKMQWVYVKENENEEKY